MLFRYLVFVLVVIALYFYMIMPKLNCNLKFKEFEKRFYAHRGLHKKKSKIPENSLPAFKLAVKENYGIELDVQLTKDKVLVVLHDFNLLRVCGVDKKVANVEYNELKEYNLFNSQEKIPTFEEVLKVIKGKVPLVVEIKAEKKTRLICQKVAELLDVYRGAYCIESFNPLVLIWYKKHRRHVMRGQLASDLNKDKKGTTNIISNFFQKNMLTNFLTKPDFIAYKYMYINNLSFRICRRLYKVKTIAWTIKTQEIYDEIKSNFDLIIFDGFFPH